MINVDTYPWAGQETLPDRLQPATYEAVYRLLDMVEDNHGPLSYDPKEYHRPKHSEKVVKYAAQLGTDAVFNGNIEPIDIAPLIIAAAGHDVICNRGETVRNEFNSAKASGEITRKTFDDFSLPIGLFQIADTVEEIIPSTIVDIGRYGLLKQHIDPDNYLTYLLCDDDLAYLGEPFGIYFSEAVRCFREAYFDIEDPKTREELFVEFFRTNVRILKDQEYHSSEAQQRYGQQRYRNHATLARRVASPSRSFLAGANSN